MGEIIMRLVGSFAFLFGALSVGALAYFPAAISHNEGPFGRFPAAPGADAVSATSTSAASRAANRDGDAARSFSPAPSVFEQLTAAFALSPSPAQPSRQISKPVETAASGTGAAWRTNVTTSSSDATGSTVAASTQPDDYMARYHLARSLQTELKRVGCYSGNVDGDWGPASKRAVFQFLEKVNATLPVDNPDYILLTLVQGHVDRACGLDCPAGQGLSAGGRCIPTVIVAQGPEQGSLLGRKALSAAPKLTSNSAKAALDRSDRPWE